MIAVVGGNPLCVPAVWDKSKLAERTATAEVNPNNINLRLECIQ
jgi:hypothetical protein